VCLEDKTKIGANKKYTMVATQKQTYNSARNAIAALMAPSVSTQSQSLLRAPSCRQRGNFLRLSNVVAAFCRMSIYRMSAGTRSNDPVFRHRVLTGTCAPRSCRGGYEASRTKRQSPAHGDGEKAARRFPSG
jgi:hypothetical protein